MITPEDVFGFMESRIAKGMKLAEVAKQALAEYSKPESAVSVLVDVLGHTAFVTFYTQAHAINRNRTIYQQPIESEPDEKSRRGRAPVREAAKDLIPSSRIRLSIFDCRLGVPGFGMVRLGDFTRDHCQAYAGDFRTTASKAKQRAAFWTSLGLKLGSKKFSDVFTSKAAAESYFEKMREAA